jgi:hypothetical protein
VNKRLDQQPANASSPSSVRNREVTGKNVPAIETREQYALNLVIQDRDAERPKVRVRLGYALKSILTKSFCREQASHGRKIRLLRRPDVHGSRHIFL